MWNFQHNLNRIIIFGILTVVHVVLIIQLSQLVIINGIDIVDQPYDEDGLSVDYLSFVTGGFVLVMSDQGDELIRSSYFPAGKYTDITLPWNEGVDMEQTGAATAYILKDTGGKLNYQGIPAFTELTQAPLYSLFGAPVLREFSIVLQRISI